MILIKAEIFKRNNGKKRLQFVVNDKMNAVDESKNRIFFEISMLDENDKKVTETIYFMNIEDTKYLCFIILNDKIPVKSKWNKVRGKDEKARSFTIIRQNSYYTIKIDNGHGLAQSNGFTSFQKKDISLYYSLSEEDAIKMALSIRDRINQKELMFLLMDNKG